MKYYTESQTYLLCALMKGDILLTDENQHDAKILESDGLARIGFFGRSKGNPYDKTKYIKIQSEGETYLSSLMQESAQREIDRNIARAANRKANAAITVAIISALAALAMVAIEIYQYIHPPL